MNNFLFNSVAEELKTSIYAQSPEGGLSLLQLDDAGRLIVAGSITLENEELAVKGTVNVAEIAAPVNVAEIVAPVNVNTISNPVMIGNETLTTTIGGCTFISDSVIDLEITGSGTIFNNADISTVKTASMYIYNKGSVPLTLSLQLSPTTNSGDYIDAPNYTNISVGLNEKKIITVSLFGHYTRLQYNMGGETGVITAYLNAQT